MTAAPQTLASWFDANGRRGPSFDMIRLFAAFTVMVSHSFSITGSPFGAWTFITQQGSPGTLAVAVFFVLSGYVIAESLRRDPRPGAFLRKRALRIYPALTVVVLCTVFVYGPLMTDLSLSQYFSSRGTAIYLLSVVFPMKEKLPGVFDHTANYFVNASLWTLRYEIICYVVVGLLGAAMLARRWAVLAVAIALTALTGVLLYGRVHAGFAAEQIIRGLPLITSFLGGMSVALFADRLPVNAAAVAVAAVLVGVSLKGGFFVVFPFAGAYLIAVLGNSSRLAFPRFRRGIFAGDFSYGVYIFAYPIQQAVFRVVGSGCSWWVDFLLSVPIVFGLAVLSWHFIEKPFLRLKSAGFAYSQKV
ncbi:MAG TPA: acyltransferase, partial [Rhizomicrobium sp.]